MMGGMMGGMGGGGGGMGGAPRRHAVTRELSARDSLARSSARWRGACKKKSSRTIARGHRPRGGARLGGGRDRDRRAAGGRLAARRSRGRRVVAARSACSRIAGRSCTRPASSTQGVHPRRARDRSAHRTAAGHRARCSSSRPASWSRPSSRRACAGWSGRAAVVSPRTRSAIARSIKRRTAIASCTSRSAGPTRC